MNKKTQEISDLEKIEVLKRVLSKEVDRELVRTDISCIIPQGASGYALDNNHNVIGIKIGRVEDKVTGQNVLDIISTFKFLQRLVFYVVNTFELPRDIVNNENIRYLDLSGVTVLPQALFERKWDIVYRTNDYYEVPRGTNLPSRLKRISDRIQIFFKYNPRLEFPITPEQMLNGDYDVSGSGIREELEMFCLTSQQWRNKILSKNGLFIDKLEVVNDPPYEILIQGVDAVLQYYNKQKTQGVERLYEAKIVIVGAGESGKTTLIKKLINPNHPVPNADDKRTEGIRVVTYPFSGDTKFGVKNIHAHIWDFGGQELYHTTHQLFLTADTLYILLNDNRKNDTDFYYWLNIVTLRAGENSPILMVFNAKDNAARQIIPGEEIFTTFPNLNRNSIDVNFADKDVEPIKKMKQTIEDNFLTLDVLGKPFPAYWVKVRNALGRLTDEYINWKQFESICKENGIDDLSQMQTLAKTLNNLGVILHFPDVFGLSDLVILKSQWCIDAIYSALDTTDIINNGGKFNEAMLSVKWSDKRFECNRLQLLKLMQHFDLCYKIDGTDEYIAPQLLPIEENKLKRFIKWSINFQLDYKFMPAGLVTRFIARMSRNIKDAHAWRSGVVLEWDDKTIAQIVEHQLTHQIVVKIDGPERKRRLLEIRRCFYSLHKDFKGLIFQEFIACNCDDCKKGRDVSFFELYVLEDDANHGDTVTCRNGERKKIQAANILNGITYDEVPRVFISYSHKNEAFKDEFRTMIAPLEKSSKWKVWDDRWLLPGDNWNREILKHLNEANIIVLMLTSDFFASSFIYDVELNRAIQRHEAGDALVIGIVISDCMWEETPLSKIQILPKEALPVERHANRSEVWKNVAAKIKETIAIWHGRKTRTTGWNQ